MLRYYSLSTYFRRKFQTKIRKIPLDAGKNCPNRDGLISTQGCTFCNAQGSGSGLITKGLNLSEQWEYWRKHYPRGPFMAYLQSFSNTYGPAWHLQEIVQKITALPEIAGIAVGTRPDCLDETKLDILATLPLAEIWLELGLQSANDSTLRRINRGHTVKDFARATEMAAQKGILVCAHLMAGLPGEHTEDVKKTITFINSLPVAGIKLHNVLVCRKTQLAKDYQNNDYIPLTFENYIQTLATVLPLLRSDIIIHRLTADPGPDELLAPAWAMQKKHILDTLHHCLDDYDIWQGQYNDADTGIPGWFQMPPLPGEGMGRKKRRRLLRHEKSLL